MSDVRCWYPGFEWMSGRSACGVDYVANSGPIAARVEDAQCRACLRSDLARGALEAHGLAQFDIQERERKIADQDERIRALTASASDSGCRCGCRSTGQADQIAELYRQISTIEAELNERKGQAMVWESDQLIIAELQQQIEKLAAEAIEAQDKVKHLELVARETLKAKLDACNERDRLAAENLQAKGWGPHKALRDAIEKAGFGGVDEYVIQRERELNAATALNAVLTERDGAMARLQRCQKQCAEIEVNRDEWRKEAKQSDEEHERWQLKAERLAGDHARLLAEKAHADGRVDDLAKSVERRDAAVSELAWMLRQMGVIIPTSTLDMSSPAVPWGTDESARSRQPQPGPCPGEDMRDHVAAQAQANQPPPTKIPSECMHDWQPAFNLERAEFVPGVLRCASCGSTRKVDQPRPKSWRTPKEEYNQIAVDMAANQQRAQPNCCDDVRIHHGHCESCGAQAGPASKENLMRQVEDLVHRNNQQAKYIKELGGVLPLFGTPAYAKAPAVPPAVAQRLADIQREKLNEPPSALGQMLGGSAARCYHDWFAGNACAKCGALRKPLAQPHIHDWRDQYNDVPGDLRVTWQQCAGCGERQDVGETVDASFETTAEPVGDQRAEDFECECPYHSCALSTVFYGHCQICGGEWIPF